VAFLREREAEEIEFQMAPMIDCVFLLLIFFLTATSFISPETQIATDLPKKEQKQQEDEALPQQFLVVVTEKGILVNKREMKKTTFRNNLIALRAGGEEVYVFVDATDEARHGDVVEVIDMARDIGAKVTVQPPYEEIE